MNSKRLRSEVLRHYQRHLGPLNRQAKRFSLAPEGVQLDVGSADNVPYVGVATYFSIGLCGYEFALPNLTRRGEVSAVLSSADSIGYDFIFMVCQQILSTGIPPVAGSGLAPAGGSLFPGTSMSTVYLTTPGLFPESFEELATEGGQPLQIWLAIPLHSAEAALAAKIGREEFESHFDSIDIANLARGPMDASVGSSP